MQHSDSDKDLLSRTRSSSDVWPPCCRGSLSRTPHCGSAVGTSPESRLSQGRGDGEWSLRLRRVIDTCLSPHDSLLSETRACSHVCTSQKPIGVLDCKCYRSTGTQSFFIYLFFFTLSRCKARQKAGFSLTHKVTCSHIGRYRFSTRESLSITVRLVPTSTTYWKRMIGATLLISKCRNVSVSCYY